MKRNPTPELSIIIPCFNEEDVIPLLLPELEKLDETLPFPVFFLFVDDGSTDTTLELIMAACQQDQRFACLSLSRNFGHQNAVSAGLRHARGDIAAVIDADLQDPPAVIPSFVEKWQEGYDVVYGIRKNRKEGWPQRLAYALFYRILKKIANIDVPLDAGDFSLMDRQVIDVINQMPEHNRFIRGLRGWVGFKQIGVAYERHERRKGESKYTFGKLLKLAFDGLISFSAVPLWLAGWMGALSAMLGFFYMLYALIGRIAGIQLPAGWTSTIIVVLFLGGIQLMVLGILGNYIGRIFDEVKNRPHYVANRTGGWLTDAIQFYDTTHAENIRTSIRKL